METPRRIGRYEILERVGRGSMGVLYRARDTVLDREVAIKVMAADFSADEQARPRFYREARAAAKLQHRNIVTIFEFAEEDGTSYIVMEFLRGRNLADRMRAAPPLTLDQKLDVMNQLSTGLQFAHEQGVVHRDVKPANIWLLDDGSVKLLDFSIAKVGASTLTAPDHAIGSASYMAPEQVTGSPVDGRADIFAAGVVLYELLTGRKPFEGESPTAVMMKIIREDPVPIRTFVPDLPVPLMAAVDRALRKNPEQRYVNAGDFGADLQLIRLTLPAAGETVGADLPPATPARAHDSAVSAGAGTGIGRPARTLVAAVSASARRLAHDPRRLWLPVAMVFLVATLWLLAAMSPKGGAKSGSPADRPPANVEGTRSTETPTARKVPSTADDLKGVALPPVAPAVVKVVSDPAGASISIDGKDTGLITPAEVKLDASQPRRLRLSKKGFQPMDARVTAVTLQSGSVSYRLNPVGDPVRITVTGSYAFEVLDGARIASAAAKSHSLTLVPPRTLRLRAADKLLSLPVKVERSGPFEFQAPELGRLTVRTALETCAVSIGGHNLGYPPIVEQAIAAGTYTIQLKCPNGRNRRSTVTILPGQLRVEIIR